MFTCRCRDVFAALDRFGSSSDGRRDDGVESAPIPPRNLPRRSPSSNATSMSSSNSPSLNCLTAWRRFFGRICRCEDVSAAGAAPDRSIGAEGASRTSSVENRSGVVSSVDSRPMASSCRRKSYAARPRQPSLPRNGGYNAFCCFGTAKQSCGL
jgi:hypothetical protein